jgi:hypothetical protein
MDCRGISERRAPICCNFQGNPWEVQLLYSYPSVDAWVTEFRAMIDPFAHRN